MTEEEKKAIETLKYLKEDKYILKSLKAKIKAYEDNDDNDECGYVLSQYEQEAIDIVLNLIEKLQKERDIYYYEWKTLEADLINKNLMPKDKIREKIEQLENEIEQLRIDKGVTYDSGIYKISLMIEAYKELLEEE